jgi:hypothetical protein
LNALKWRPSTILDFNVYNGTNRIEGTPIIIEGASAGHYARPLSLTDLNNQSENADAKNPEDQSHSCNNLDVDISFRQKRGDIQT